MRASSSGPDTRGPDLNSPMTTSPFSCSANPDSSCMTGGPSLLYTPVAAFDLADTFVLGADLVVVSTIFML